MKVAIFLLGCLMMSCVSQPVVPPDLTSQKIIQIAQEETLRENWNNALYYYEILKERFPDNNTQLIADYEIAFIHYKQKKYQESQQLFQSLLDTYYDESSSIYPLWPKILSEKLLATVEERLSR